MAENNCKGGVITLDPVDGLVNYISDIKPYHTKIIEVLVEYVYEEQVNVTIGEQTQLDIEMDFPKSSVTFSCDQGYGYTLFENSVLLPIVSPSPSISFQNYPAIDGLTDTFVVPGNQTGDLAPGTDIEIIASIENRQFVYDIVAVNSGPAGMGYFDIVDVPESGSPAYTFVNRHPVGSVIEAYGTDNNDNRSFKITSVTTGTGSPYITRVFVEQAVLSDTLGGSPGPKLGLVRTVDTANSGTYTVQQSIYSAGTINKYVGMSLILGDEPHTNITVDGSLTSPTFNTAYETYSAHVRIQPLDIERVLSYSNLDEPDEGFVRRDVVDLILGSPNSFVVSGNVEVSNIFVGDAVQITQSFGNNGVYTISSISYDSGNDETTITVEENIPNSTVDGIAIFDVPSNVFVVDGNHVSRFGQGKQFIVDGGTYAGSYTTLTSDFFGGKTRIRTTQDIINPGAGRDIINATTGFVIVGDLTTTFTTGSQFNIVNSPSNDGSYTVASSSYNSTTQQTTIIPNEPFVSEAGGEVFATTLGRIKEDPRGYNLNNSLPFIGDTFQQNFGSPSICRTVDENVVSVKIDEHLLFEGFNLDFEDDVIVYNLENTDNWGLDFPLGTIVSSTQPSIFESLSPPAFPTVLDLWYDTNVNTLKQYRGETTYSGNPVWEPIQTAYWFDTTNNIFYYRTKYGSTGTSPVNVDTGWVIDFIGQPSYSAVFPAQSDLQLIDQEGFSYLGTTTFNLSTGVPGTPPDPTLLKVTVNQLPADFVLNSSTEFDIVSPVLTDGDLITAEIYDRSGTQQNAHVNGLSPIPHQVYHHTIYVDDVNNAFILPGGNFAERFDVGFEFQGVGPISVVDTWEPAYFTIKDIYGSPNVIVIDGDYSWLFQPGRTFYANDLSGTKESFVVDSVTTAGSPQQTYITVSSINQDFNGGIIYGAVYQSEVSGSPPPTTSGQVETIVVPTTPVDTDVTSIIYTWVGPLRMNIHSALQANVSSQISDIASITNELAIFPQNIEIVDTDASANTFTIHYDDPDTGNPVDLTEVYTPGTIFKVAGSKSSALPLDHTETNDYYWVVKSSTFNDPNGSPAGNGDVVITVEDNFDNIPPYNSFTVVDINNYTGSPAGSPILPNYIELSGDHVTLFERMLTTVFRIDQPLVSSDPLYNTLTVTDVELVGGNTRLFVEETFIDVNYTGSLGIVEAVYGAGILFDETNTTGSPGQWIHGYIQREVSSVETNQAAAFITENLDFGWGTTQYWAISGIDANTSTIYIDGDITGALDVNDRSSIVGSQNIDGDYEVSSFTYNGGLNRTEITLAYGGSPNPFVNSSGSPELYGYFKLEDIDITNWYQYLIKEALPSRGSPPTPENVFEVYGNATGDIQDAQQFRVLGTSNDGVYTVNSSPTYNPSTGTTDIPVASISTNEKGGWVESYRDYGIRLIFEDTIGVSTGENATGAVLTTGGNIMDAWDYNFWDVGSFDETLGTVIHLYSNTL